MYIHEWLHNVFFYPILFMIMDCMLVLQWARPNYTSFSKCFKLMMMMLFENMMSQIAINNRFLKFFQIHFLDLGFGFVYLGLRVHLLELAL